MKLYEIADNYLSIFHELEDEDNIMCYEEILDDVKETFNEKSIQIGAYILNLELEIDAIRKVEKRLHEKRGVLNARKDRLKYYLLFNMKKLDLESVKSKDSSFNIKINEGRLSVNVINEDKIPDNFYVTKKELSKESILRSLKEGVKIEGVELKKVPYITIK